jgi:hypothetical protein
MCAGLFVRGSFLQDGNMCSVLELAGHASAAAGGADWWWQERLGKARYQMGLLRDAATHFAAAAELQVCACLYVRARIMQPVQKTLDQAGIANRLVTSTRWPTNFNCRTCSC